MINISTSYACKIIIIINVVIIIERDIKEQLASQFILLQVGSFTPNLLRNIIEGYYFKMYFIHCVYDPQFNNHRKYITGIKQEHVHIIVSVLK